MKLFLKRIVLIGLIFLTSFLVLFTVIDFIGLSDYAYKRVVSKEEGSLIVGTSRAAQALQPSIMNPILSQIGYSPIFNFSFTIFDSPFGEVYYSAITKKVKKQTDYSSKRLFIVCVDPFSLSDIQEIDLDGIRERNGVLHGLPFFFKPNYVYLAKNYKPRDWARRNEYETLHDDGWLEISVKMDSVSVEKNKASRIALYRGYTATSSQDRMDWLIKTIDFFSKYGDVCLCRLSTCYEMNGIEDCFWPRFDTDMNVIANRFNIRYYSFYDDYDKYRTTDGNHIYKEDGKKISKALCDSILFNKTHYVN